MNIKRQFKNARRSVRFFFQRVRRGWDDSETWSLDFSLSQLILPRLKRFKTLRNSMIISDPEWDHDMDKMIKAFEFLGDEARWDCYDNAKWEEAQEGIELFAKNYTRLWW